MNGELLLLTNEEQAFLSLHLEENKLRWMHEIKTKRKIGIWLDQFTKEDTTWFQLIYEHGNKVSLFGLGVQFIVFIIVCTLCIPLCILMWCVYINQRSLYLQISSSESRSITITYDDLNNGIYIVMLILNLNFCMFVCLFIIFFLVRFVHMRNNIEKYLKSRNSTDLDFNNSNTDANDIYLANVNSQNIIGNASLL